MEKMVKSLIFYLSIFIVLIGVGSCGSHLVITTSDCQDSDSLEFFRSEGRWFTGDLKTSINKKTQFRYDEKTHSFFGNFLSPTQKISPCEMIQHQKAKNITLQSGFTFYDVLWGLIPGYSPRTVTFRGDYEL